MTFPNSVLSLRDLLDALRLDYTWVHVPGALGPGAIHIANLSHDHHRSEPGGLHFCIRGATHDGHRFARDAVGAGAVALVCGYQIEDVPVPQILVNNVRQAMAQMACTFYGDPSRRLKVVGVTGTSGKSSTTEMTRDILTALGAQVSAFGTLTGRHTTPESLIFQRRLAEAEAAGKDTVVTEVTSHSLVQYRVAGTAFRVGAFTNLSADHLDYHKTMEDYFGAKRRLFQAEMSEQCVVNVSTDWGVRLAAMIEPSRLRTFNSRDIVVHELTPRGAAIEWRGCRVDVPVTPRFYINNAVTAAEIALALGHDAESVAAAMSTVRPILGRYEVINMGQDFVVVVDYARTPESLQTMLTDTRELYPRRMLTVVFGCKGDQDKEKRMDMGAAAASLADRVILTSDNPGWEDPEAIAQDILAGVPEQLRPKVRVVADRASAIGEAVWSARSDDVILVTGKGLEQYQDIEGERHPFQDQQVLRAELSKRLEQETI